MQRQTAAEPGLRLLAGLDLGRDGRGVDAGRRWAGADQNCLPIGSAQQRLARGLDIVTAAVEDRRANLGQITLPAVARDADPLDLGVGLAPDLRIVWVCGRRTTCSSTNTPSIAQIDQPSRKRTAGPVSWCRRRPSGMWTSAGRSLMTQISRYGHHHRHERATSVHQSRHSERCGAQRMPRTLRRDRKNSIQSVSWPSKIILR